MNAATACRSLSPCDHVHHNVMNVVVIGGTGTLGWLVTSELAARGHRVELVPRIEARDPAAIARRRAPVIVSCAGASVAFARSVAAGAAIARLTCRSASPPSKQRGEPERDFVYAGARLSTGDASHAVHRSAHERVDYRDGRRRRGCVVRATGILPAACSAPGRSRVGWLLDVGDGQAHTN